MSNYDDVISDQLTVSIPLGRVYYFEIVRFSLFSHATDVRIHGLSKVICTNLNRQCKTLQFYI